MIPSSFWFKMMLSFMLSVVHMATFVSSSTQFASHVSVNTPARSFTHGVGDPISILKTRVHSGQALQFTNRNSRNPWPSQKLVLAHGIGYPKLKPTIPFTREDGLTTRTLSISPWQNTYKGTSRPALPPSPYKVDSPDPESLWPEGLFIPPSTPPRFMYNIDRSSDIEYNDPYLLEGSNAIASVQRSEKHGKLYFHEIPHIESLLANQEERIKNNLKPHVLGSIRLTWPYYRP